MIQMVLNVAPNEINELCKVMLFMHAARRKLKSWLREEIKELVERGN